MASFIPGYEYDIFISYRQNDNRSGWVTEFVAALQEELAATFKEPISVYFDINPQDGLLETHSVDKSLQGKLKCLIFIPVISQTYCDPKSFAWQHEFCAFNRLALEDQFGRDIKLSSGNVTSRILPIKIHDLDPDDKSLFENELGGFLRGIEFIYKSAGVNRPLRANEDHPQDNLNKTYYRDQINKVANAAKEIINALKKQSQYPKEVETQDFDVKPVHKTNQKIKIIVASILVLALIMLGYFLIPKLMKPSVQLEKSIAVLPFINDSPDQENTYFINGIMEDILNNLQKIKEMRVISRTSVEQYRNKTKSIPEIAKKLDVNYIVEGSGQKFGNTIRLSVQLISAAREGHLWGNSYEQEIHNAKELFDIQKQISETIAGELKAVITPQEKNLIEKIPTANLAAYEAYLQGIFYLRKYTQHDCEVALQYFEQAKEKDPKYALAYAGIFGVWLQRGQASFASPAEANPKAMNALTKALELDSTCAEVYLSLANVKIYMEWDWESAESSLKKAIALNPNYADALNSYSCLLIILRRMKEAIEQSELALKLDPLSLDSKVWYGLALLFAHRYDDAVTTFQEVLKMDPAHAVAVGCLPGALHQIGKYEEELEAWKSYYNTTFKDFANVFDQGYAKGGYVGALTMEADTLVVQSKTKYINPFEIALIYVCAGNKKRAIDMLERGYNVHDPNTPFLSFPVFDILRDEPRFQALCRKMNLPYK
jgi:TolB-like protein